MWTVVPFNCCVYVQVTPPHTWLQTVLSAVTATVSTASPKAIAIVLWSLIKLSHDPGREFMTAAVNMQLSNAQQLQPQTLAVTLWVCAVRGFRPSDQQLTDLLYDTIKQVQTHGY